MRSEKQIKKKNKKIKIRYDQLKYLDIGKGTTNSIPHPHKQLMQMGHTQT